MLVLVMNDLDQLVPGPLQPEQRGGLLEVGQSVVELERRVKVDVFMMIIWSRHCIQTVMGGRPL